jgi:hypothetical protein
MLPSLFISDNYRTVDIEWPSLIQKGLFNANICFRFFHSLEPFSPMMDTSSQDWRFVATGRSKGYVRGRANKIRKTRAFLTMEACSERELL